MNKTRGQFTLPVGVTIALAGWVGSYFSAQLAIHDRISEAKAEVSEKISTDEQDIATLKEAIRRIDTNQAESRADIKEILKRLK